MSGVTGGPWTPEEVLAGKHLPPRPSLLRLLLDELDTLQEKATPGPWWAWNRGVGWHLAVEDPTGIDHLPGRPHLVPEGGRTDLGRGEDAAFIVAAVNAAPQMTAVLRAVVKVRDALEAAMGSAAAEGYRPVIDAEAMLTALDDALTPETAST